MWVQVPHRPWQQRLWGLLLSWSGGEGHLLPVGGTSDS